MHLWFRFVIDLESGKAGQKLSAVWVITALYERGVDIKNEFERFTIALREVLRNA